MNRTWVGLFTGDDRPEKDAIADQEKERRLFNMFIYSNGFIHSQVFLDVDLYLSKARTGSYDA